MSKKEKKSNDNKKNSSEKDTNLNSDLQKRYLQDSPNSDDIEKDKPIHFQVEYEQNKNFENQMESSSENKKKKINSESPNLSNKKEREQEFIIEKNNQINNIQNNNKNQDFFQENNINNNNYENNQNNLYYNLLKENLNENNNNYIEDNNFNNYYYYYLNNYNNKNINNKEDEFEQKKVISFATKTYNGRIDPVKLNRKYNNFWKNQNKSKQKYKAKIDALQKVFHPYGYNSVTKSFKKRNMSQSRYSIKIYMNEYDRPPFDNTKQPLPKNSF